MISILIVVIPTIVCLLFAISDIVNKKITMETWLLLFFGFVGAAVAGILIGHDFALWSLSQ